MMATTREDLRDHLTAVIEAAQELPKEDRSYLADSFLDDLETHYQLVPRSQGVPRTDASSSRPKFTGFPFGWWPAPIGLLFLLPVLLVSMFVFVHPPFLLFGLILLFVFRAGRPRMRRGGPWQQGSERGGTSRFNF
jgi:hypothetical protein